MGEKLLIALILAVAAAIAITLIALSYSNAVRPFTTVESPHPTRDGATNVQVFERWGFGPFERRGDHVADYVSITAAHLQAGDHLYLVHPLLPLPGNTLVEVESVDVRPSGVLVTTSEGTELWPANTHTLIWDPSAAAQEQSLLSWWMG